MLSPKSFPFLFLCGLAACGTQASSDDAQMAVALSAQGRTLLAAGKNAEARDIYLSALSRDDENARAWNGLGVADDLLGKRAEARDAYRHALDLVPQDAVASNNLAHLYLEEGDAASAARMLTPYANDKNAPVALKQNLANATKAAISQEPYADLGNFPTEGMARGQISKAKAVLENTEDLSFLIVPEVNGKGGTPVFAVKAVGRDPQSICDSLSPQACVPYGKK